jgi:hypothetical protein
VGCDYCLTVAGLLIWGALSDERLLLLVFASGIFLWSASLGTRDHILLSQDLRLPFSSLPTTRRVTVDVFYPASIRMNPLL